MDDLYGAAYLYGKIAFHRAGTFPLDSAIMDTASVKAKIYHEAHKRQGGGAGGAGNRGQGGKGCDNSGAGSTITRIHSTVNEEQVTSWLIMHGLPRRFHRI